MVCFVHFDFEMCFAATTECTFSTSELPKMVRIWCVLYILTWKNASRHNTVHFFIWPHGSAPAAFYFSTLPTHKSLANHSVSRLSLHFAHLYLLCSYSFSFSLLLFLSSTLSLFYSFSLLLFLSSTLLSSSLLISSLLFSLLLFSLLLFSTLLSSTLLFSLTLPLSAFHLSIVSEVWLLNFLWIIWRIYSIYKQKKIYIILYSIIYRQCGWVVPAYCKTSLAPNEINHKDGDDLSIN